jgi:hypothetical protein
LNNQEPDYNYGYSEQILKLTYERFPYRIEDAKVLFERGLALRRYLQNFLSLNLIENS